MKKEKKNFFFSKLIVGTAGSELCRTNGSMVFKTLEPEPTREPSVLYRAITARFNFDQLCSIGIMDQAQLAEKRICLGSLLNDKILCN